MPNQKNLCQPPPKNMPVGKTDQTPKKFENRRTCWHSLLTTPCQFSSKSSKKKSYGNL